LETPTLQKKDVIVHIQAFCDHTRVRLLKDRFAGLCTEEWMHAEHNMAAE